jgi:site-specific DNA-methyltransferase (adenine-specific)
MFEDINEPLNLAENGNSTKPMLPAVPSSEVYLEDCVTALKRYADNHFDLAIVDPPYGLGIDGQKGDVKKGVQIRKAHSFKGWDNAIPTAEYFAELKRVSKNQIIWGANYFTEFLPPTKAWIFWYKGQQDLTMSDGEMAWTSLDKVTRMVNIHRTHIWQEKPMHPTQKPVKLYDWILNKYATEGDLILDTHLGSGSSRIAAYKGGFNFVGFEIDKEYYEKQEKRFNEFKSQLRLF